MSCRCNLTCAIALLILLVASSQTYTQISGPIEATVGNPAIKMEYGNNANAPTADEVVVGDLVGSQCVPNPQAQRGSL